MAKAEYVSEITRKKKAFVLKRDEYQIEKGKGANNAAGLKARMDKQDELIAAQDELIAALIARFKVLEAKLA